MSKSTTEYKYNIALDAMGGDYAPQKTIHGAILALEKLESETKLVLFGRKKQIIAEIVNNT